MSKFLSIDPYNILGTISSFRNEFKNLPDKYIVDSLLSTTKKAIFLKILHERSLRNNRHLLSIIYDLLCCVSTIKNNEERYFYFNIRSCIENSIRFFLNKSNDDEIGVTRMFLEFKEKYKNIDAVSNLARIYTEACNYVHNNEKAGIDISKSFQFIDSEKVIDNKKARRLCKHLLDFHLSLNEILLINNKSDITSAYLYINENIVHLISADFLESLFND
ncbi:hypothetical protein M979_0325 [Buttiauxella noackiae ATCC 51607]|uniref:Uncharacterized protein n=1 Tax=Buttiauxella noackiae ATCC 51607 TaxID=1354255 RepID=A0A1B7I0G3_9ENTR|nr:hypothetical protein [Buttiauxella noackiae]OAT21466.1 hypothetical protein M979_0325 [Buttiauxella noackiae ATCC 51607]